MFIIKKLFLWFTLVSCRCGILSFDYVKQDMKHSLLLQNRENLTPPSMDIHARLTGALTKCRTRLLLYALCIEVCDFEC